MKAGPKDSLKKVLGYIPCYSGALSEHVILEASLDPNLRVVRDMNISNDSPSINGLFEAFQKTHNAISEMETKKFSGHLIIKQQSDLSTDQSSNNTEESKVGEIADEYLSLVLNQTRNKAGIIIKKVDSFQTAVDTFYSKIDAIRIIKQVNTKESNVKKKLENMKLEQAARIEKLDLLQQGYLKKAQLITGNLDYVEQVLLLIRSALAAEIDWDELKELVEQQKQANHPVAKNIHSLNLASNKVTISFDSEEQSSSGSTLAEIDLELTAFSNAQSYFDLQKQTISKLARTKASEEMAYKKAEKKITGKSSFQKKQSNIDLVLKANRKPMWFEAFIWFISSDGYLAVGGKDMQQNEQLVRKYLKKDDIYVHADTHGSTSIVLINNYPGKPIPISTLIQAGDMAICHSKAWESKIITSAYWVNSDQVSKKANTGEYLPTGSFMIRGKKNFLPPTSLVYGFGILFKIEKNPDYEDKDEEDEKSYIYSNFNAPKNSDESFDKLREKYNLDLVDELTEIKDSKLPAFISGKAQDSIISNGEPRSNSQSDLTSINEPIITKKRISSKQRKEMKKNNSTGQNQTEKSDLLGITESLSVLELDRTDENQREISEDNFIEKGSKGDNNKKASNNSKSKSKEQLDNQQKQNPRRKKANVKNNKKNRGFDDFEDDEIEKEIRDSLLKTSSKTKKKDKKLKGIPPLQKTNTKSNNIKSSLKSEQSKEPNVQYPAPIVTELDFEQTEELTGVKNEFLKLTKSLTSNPDSSNFKYLLKYAIPMCAPYNTLKNYKYKVKLTPGDLKKGKSTKTAKNLFVHSANKELELLAKSFKHESKGLNNDEGEVEMENKMKEMDNAQIELKLLKLMNDNEMISVILGNSKVSAPNLEKIKLASKQQKKASKQSKK
ncbi:Nuclear export mediator factor Nemf [Smittium culicis]|uniref:Nuclear export mediator factor Nemf n=1 Tax=Smittium culicis TaxID=133412 RepID=A0A1R1XQ88_9FUNG|nr:Nuclear export mediator factor Nemf [Smittium culicis]